MAHFGCIRARRMRSVWRGSSSLKRWCTEQITTSSWSRMSEGQSRAPSSRMSTSLPRRIRICGNFRSEEHTSELQSQSNLVCRLLLEKKKKHHQEILCDYIVSVEWCTTFELTRKD